MPTRERGYGIAAGGVIIHELGGARMGDDPKTSVTNGWCQAHECKNLFVTDGAPFVSQADKNPTWTIRSEEHTSELQSQSNLVCRLLLEKKKTTTHTAQTYRQWHTISLY